MRFGAFLGRRTGSELITVSLKYLKFVFWSLNWAKTGFVHSANFFLKLLFLASAENIELIYSRQTLSFPS